MSDQKKTGALVGIVAKTPKRPPRGRRPGTQVPCDLCIARISQPGMNNDLCENCKATLLQQRQPNHTKASSERRQHKELTGMEPLKGFRAIDVLWGNNEQENHALEFFAQYSAPQLAGCFDSPFWQLMVLQAGRREPAVKHALAALGSLHEKLLMGAIDPADSQDHRMRFALEQCNKSIQYLLPKAGQVERLGLLLTTCVLFTCFEALQGNCEKAILHAMQGYKIIQQNGEQAQKASKKVDPFAVELDDLCTLIHRLQTQSRGLMGRRCTPAFRSSVTDLEPPTSFASLCEARTSLEKALHKVMTFCLEIPLNRTFDEIASANAEKHALFVPWLEAWEVAFGKLLARIYHSMTVQQKKGASILKAHHLIAEVYAHVDLSLGEMSWDAHKTRFIKIVELAETVLKGTRQSDASIIEARWKTGGVFIASPAATLTFSLGIVDPLYEVCARCRDPAIRRRALTLLAKYPMQDCVWSSWSAWRVGKFLMRLEEDGLRRTATTASDITAEFRVAETWLDFSQKTPDTPSRGRVGYKRVIARDDAHYAIQPRLFDWDPAEPIVLPLPS